MTSRNVIQRNPALSGLLFLGIVSTVLLIGLVISHAEGSPSSNQQGEPTYSVLAGPDGIDEDLAALLPEFVVPDTARLAFSDSTGDYVVARSGADEVCVVWLSSVKGAFTACQDLEGEFPGLHRVVAGLAGGEAAGGGTRLFGLVPDEVVNVELLDGEKLEVRSNVVSAPSDTFGLRVDGEAIGPYSMTMKDPS